MDQNLSSELLSFIEKSPSCFHVVENMRQELDHAGFTALHEGSPWTLQAGMGYYVTRNGSSLIAFQIPGKDFIGYQIMASHSDSPCFKIKENAEMDVDGKFTRLNVEKYGGMLCAPWMDRPLSIAGRIMVRDGERIHSRLVNIDRDLVLIPNLAIHMNREVNDGYKYNAQSDMLPLYGDGSAKGTLMKAMAESAGVPVEDILSTDLFLYNRMKGTFWGANEEYISSPRLDDLQCAFSSLKGLLASKGSSSVTVHCVLDNEEVGSTTKQGAASTFLRDTLLRINAAMGRTKEQYHMSLTNSFMLSADNAHSVHPNHMDKADPTNRPVMNGGIVIKFNANQKYTTDAVSAAVFKTLCEREEIPCQIFTNRSDMLGGSTLGNIANTQTAMNTVDIGLAQLAMHSPYETAGAHDTAHLVKAAAAFFSSTVTCECDGTYRIAK